MTLVDSSVWIDFFNGKRTPETTFLRKLLLQEPIAIGDIILAEVLQGFSSDTDFHLAKTYLLRLPCFQIGSKSIAIASAEHYRFLRKKGVTIRKTIDMLIGTFCIENGHTLLHSDRDFYYLEKHLKLQIRHP